MDLNLSGHRALVTGSTAGIGRALALRLLLEGADVIVNGRDPARTQKAADDLDNETAAAGGTGRATPVAADLGAASGATALVEAATDGGPIDILVNNAGFFEHRPFVETTDDEWSRLHELNVMSGVRLSRALLPAMLARGWGRILFMASEAAIKPIPEMLHYSVTKASQVALARGLAEMTRGTAVTVNSLLVAPTWTEGVEAFLAKAADTNTPNPRRAYFEGGDGRSSLLGRFAEPDEIAAAAAFLCSPLSAAVNGAAQRVDGGIIRTTL